MHWTVEADQKLFATLLRVHNFKHLDYAAIAEAMGEGLTPNAISKRIKRIKDNAKAVVTSSVADEEESETPKKRDRKVKADGTETSISSDRKVRKRTADGTMKSEAIDVDSTGGEPRNEEEGSKGGNGGPPTPKKLRLTVKKTKVSDEDLLKKED